MELAEARVAAKRQFGNPTLLREASCEMWGVKSIEAVFQDLRYGVRTLLNNPGFTLIAVLTLALGIGANTAIFSLVNAVLVRPLPFPHPERIMTVWAEAPSAGIVKQNVAPGNYSDLKSQQTIFEQMSALSRSEMSLTGLGEAEKLEGFAVLDSVALDILGIKPVIGRLFLQNDAVSQAGRAKTARPLIK